MKRYPLLSVASVLVFLLASAGAASAQQKLAGGPITVGILLLNKPYVTEFAGPLDVYHHVPEEKLKVFIISDTDQELVTYEGMPFRANYTIENAPKLDVLVVPSGAGSLEADLKNVRVITWYPTCRVQAGQRIVVDGNLITSPGGLASYEASLYVVEQLFGKEQALSIAAALVFGPSNIAAAITTK